jgi:hypothetical protein
MGDEVMKQEPGFLTESFARAIIPAPAALGQSREQRAESKKPQGQAPVI